MRCLLVDGRKKVFRARIVKPGGIARRECTSLGQFRFGRKCKAAPILTGIVTALVCVEG
jgi:hypothetical protein